MNLLRRSQPAYTLLEVLTVAALLAVLALLVNNQLSTLRVRSQNARAAEDISAAGSSVEAFKAANDGKLLIVQEPSTSGSTRLVCFGNPVNSISCYPTNGLSPSGDNGFASSIFTGKDNSSTFQNLSFLHAAGKSFAYYYITQDCSNDTVASSGGHHKYSNFGSYMLVTGISPLPNGDSPDNYWVRDGSSGRGPDTSVPVLPLWNPSPYSLSGLNGYMSTCQSTYP
jgi:prepilin-type N-terminal cleavage/methylation domain-containing protein